MFPPLLEDLNSVESNVRSCLLLYSGGLDSSYFLWWAGRKGIRVVALHVHLGPGEPDAGIGETALRLGAEHCTLDRTTAFVDGYLRPGIRANCLYQGQFPVSSSLSRPLMAEEAVRLARAKSLDCIIHTAGFVQNSASRFNLALRQLAPDLLVGNPFIGDPVSREAKRAALQQAGVEIGHGIYSVDENLWARVIECGELDDPAASVPEHVFSRTRHPREAPGEDLEVALRFEEGIPVAIDRRRLPLRTVVEELSRIGGLYGVGRYNGFEDTLLGLKNHEVREAPAAAALLLAHASLECAVLPQREMRIKLWADREWTELVAHGFWHATPVRALGTLVEILSQDIAGEVTLLYRPGSVFTCAVRAEGSPGLWNVGREADRLVRGFSYGAFLDLATLRDGLRTRTAGHPLQSTVASTVTNHPNKDAL